MRTIAELGIDISKQKSKALDRYLGEPFDYVTTVRDDVNEACPRCSSMLNSACSDPSRTLPKVTRGEEERLEVFRSGRDKILDRIKDDLVS